MIFFKVKVRIRFYSGLENYIKTGLSNDMDYSIHPNEDTKMIIRSFLPDDVLNYIGLVLVNKKPVSLNEKVKDQDLIEVFPLVDGG